MRERLQEACAALDYEFWPDRLSLRDDWHSDFRRAQGHNRITDLYLLALAVSKSGRFVSFAQSTAPASVPRAAPDHLLLL